MPMVFFLLSWQLPIFRLGLKYILLDLILYVPINNFSVKLGQVFLVFNQYVARVNVSCSRTQHSDASQARTGSPLVSSQALYHRATVLQIFKLFLTHTGFILVRFMLYFSRSRTNSDLMRDSPASKIHK